MIVPLGDECLVLVSSLRPVGLLSCSVQRFQKAQSVIEPLLATVIGIVDGTQRYGKHREYLQCHVKCKQN